MAGTAGVPERSRTFQKSKRNRDYQKTLKGNVERALLMRQSCCRSSSLRLISVLDFIGSEDIVWLPQDVLAVFDALNDAPQKRLTFGTGQLIRF